MTAFLIDAVGRLFKAKKSRSEKILWLVKRGVLLRGISAVCQESSQRSFVLSTILEICVDYLACGVGVEGTKAYVNRLKAIASEELVEADELDLTPTGLSFQQTFGIPLTKVRESDLEKITNTIDSSYLSFEKWLLIH